MISRVPIALFIIGLLCLAVLPVTAAVSISSSTPQIIAKGNDLTVKGSDATNGTIALWIIGRNYISRQVLIPDSKGNYIHTIYSEDTRQFDRAQYAFVIQDPGMNGKLDVEYRVDDNGDIILQNQGKTFADIGARENLRASLVPLISEFSATAANPSTDDIFTAQYFFIEDPSVDFDHLSGASRLPDVAAGSPVILGGSTNLGVHDMLRGEIRNHGTGNPVISANIPVQAGAAINRWSWDVDASTLPAGTYDVSIWRQNAYVNCSASAVFSILPELTATPTPASSNPLKLSWSWDSLLPYIILIGLALVIASFLYTLRKR